MCAAKVERGRGHRPGDQWTTEGLWSPSEDDAVRAVMDAEGERIARATWAATADRLGRTIGAVRLRAYNLRKREAARAC